MNRPLKRTAALCFGLVMAETVSGCGSETTSASQSQSLDGSGSSETAQHDQPQELFDPGPKFKITVTNPGKDPEVRTYRFRVGDTVTQTQQSQVKIGPDTPGAPVVDWTNTTRSKRTITSIEDGVATIRDVIEAADTTLPKSQSPQASASTEKSAAAMVGKATYTLVGARGQVIGTNTHEAGPRETDDTRATLLFPTTDAVGSGMQPWPDEPVGVGATWTQVSTEEVPGTATTATTTSHVTLVSIDSGVATLNSTSTVTYTPRSKSIGTVEGTGEGTSTSTVTLGDFLHQATHNDSKLRTKMTASTAAGLTQEVTVDTKTKG